MDGVINGHVERLCGILYIQGILKPADLSPVEIGIFSPANCRYTGHKCSMST